MSARQQQLFSSEPWEVDEQAEQCVATVVPSGQPLGPLDYLVPDSLRTEVEPGRRVEVPLGRGNRLVVGYCVAVENRPAGGRPLKAIRRVLDQRNLLSPAMLRLTRWIADYYLCDWATVLDTVVPSVVRGKVGTRLATLLSVAPQAATRWAEQKLASKQLAVLKVLAEAGRPLEPGELARAARCTLAPIHALRRKGLIRAERRRIETKSLTVATPAVPRQPPLALNPDQTRALEAILAALRRGRHETILIHGVTGSGKTEVYMQAIQEVLCFGRQAIVLVPEISLTPQMIERFRGRFGEVAVLHSHLSDAERHWHWQRIASGSVSVVVGARSAVFAPTPRLGLIVIDEEQEGSFKQEIAPRYHAREVALARATSENIPLVLGSATPSLESWYRARQGEYRLVELPRRVLGRPLPAVGTIDLRCEAYRAQTRGAISPLLHRAIADALREGGQVILLLNRRGFSTHIQCPACGWVLRCASCDIALTHHRAREVALCHYCDYECPAPPACQKCNFRGIRYSGLGTQRLEAEVRARFPGVPLLRMDTDSMKGRGSYEQAWQAFRQGKVRILLGTQMIAKGLDFPDVTLVGVVNADTALHLPDFRAAERTFQLVTQVAGRTGRGPRGGRVYVQTLCPEHPAIQAALRHDYAAFAAEELPTRQIFQYPPFGSMIRLVIRGPVAGVAGGFAKLLGERLRAAVAEYAPEARVLGPAPAPLVRLRGLFRFQIHLQGTEGERLRAAARAATQNLDPPEKVQWIVDVDPLDML
jgi:primosomal protein N' (replication factor Y)